MASELFFFGVNTGIRLGFAAGNGTELRNPVTGALAGGGCGVRARGGVLVAVLLSHA